MTKRERCYLRGVRRYLAAHPRLLKPYWRDQCRGEHPLCGHCALGAESFFWLAGGKPAGWNLCQMKWEGAQHWFAQRGRCGSSTPVVDPTFQQYRTRPDYRLGHGGWINMRGTGPTKRAREVIAAVRRACGG
jgi:hypothetical protein